MRWAWSLCLLLAACEPKPVDLRTMLPREVATMRTYEGGESVVFSLPSDWEILPPNEPEESLRLIVAHSADNSAQLLLLRFTEEISDERLLKLVQEKYFQGPTPISTSVQMIHNLSGLRAELLGSLGTSPIRGSAYVFSWRQNAHVFLVSTHENAAEKNIKTLSAILESIRGL